MSSKIICYNYVPRSQTGNKKFLDILIKHCSIHSTIKNNTLG